MNALLHFPRKWFQLRHSKIPKKMKNAFFKRLQHLFLSSRLLQNHSLRSFLWSNFDLNSFVTLCITFPENSFNFVTQTLQKTEKCPFQTLRTFVFKLKVASKPFPEKLLLTKFRLKKFWTLCPIFPENSFNYAAQKFQRLISMTLSKVHNIRFWPEGSWKTVFWNTYYEQL